MINMLKQTPTQYLWALLLLLLLVFSPQSIAQQTLDTLKVTSKSYQGSADFLVTLPNKYAENTDKKYIVLIDFHPASQPYLAGLHHWMSHNGGWPWLETIIVTAPDGHPGLGKLKTFTNAEQGQAFLSYVEDDLLAAIDKKYRTNGFKILSGFTGNATLGLFTLIQRPKLFNAYIVASPILSENYLSVMKDTPNLVPALSKLAQPRMLFLSRADSDFEQKQIADFDKLVTTLKQQAPSNLLWKSKVFEGSYYMSQPALATIYAIEQIFNDVHTVIEPDSTIGKAGPEAIYTYFQQVSNKYGFDVSAVDSLLALAKSKTKLEDALLVYQFAVEKYPQNAHTHHGLALGFAAVDEMPQAIAELQLALTMTKHPFYLHHWGKLLEEYQTK
ncbi:MULTISPECIES: alpha/beta hydrolase-fold protein [Shewanella]|uniref:Alpha/beta hydrolase-fold protein n=1 Tax=Shewanella holmiensis TaxID=2952222 RepID=A0A9X3AV76_9GAMM|nr:MULTISPECIES: alpha/beta hydrolase-fold protein [Shewanella]MCT7941989.1 alpha/beta hydrolase-fold protein [Shewanella holmiensis]MDP5146273.1 alpha/beta hydrolase-fold protein [Shewanella sp. ULN5]